MVTGVPLGVPPLPQPGGMSNLDAWARDLVAALHSAFAALASGDGAGPLEAPSYTTAERDALSPTGAWIIWNSTTSKFQGWTGAVWVDFH